MKIIILGAGQVGGSLAENLVGEDSDITLVDSNRDALAELKDKLDLRAVYGHAAHPQVLLEAGADDADLLIAVTNSDEINMTACQVAYTLFNLPTKIARIRNEDYIDYARSLFYSSKQQCKDNHSNKPMKGGFVIDELIAPENLVTGYIRRLVDYPGALQVLQFADKKVSLVAVRAYYGGPLVGHALSALREHMPNVDARVAAIFRQGRPVRPQGTTIIEADDEVFFIAATGHIRAVMSELQKLENHYKKIMIVGGGNIGAGLAKQLEGNHRVKLIERNPKCAERLSQELTDATVFVGDGADHELLSEEHIEQTDLFIAVTNDDEANIMSSMLAKRMGAKKVMVLIQRGVYADLMEDTNIDITISPQQITISALLSHVRRGDISNVYSLRRGAAEAIEAIANGDSMTSKVVGRRVMDIKLPPGATIGAIVRGNDVLIAHDKTQIQSADHVILFLINKKHIGDIERLFSPSAFFL
ncbi:Trk system potassium transporter TrkA [Psychrobium sp. 1_MG-2023]|uniref:Trk system potassium transporter TrkA n=1 Tax=Psychrobium sp. 1_MG-2023 TaxID=3062624 RepID=UPI000C3317B7|nr:Trk system potassium transporter TrkA [Psychrobium sp. 1_MG-2023]MDP2560400.1 Trk system potassium transporter TrkA [Psychrobium sp. 1_MG-2023]PKF57931.1 Trk system potassium transporter TrkA [Alteromonadales bacterium alter-6D02]